MPPDDIRDLPVYPFLDGIADTLERSGALMLRAETGAGKTTLVPWRLLARPAFSGSRIALLQPRRIAARAAADRIAALLGEKPGRTVGLRTRHETVTGKTTRLEVVTEGILTRIIQNDQSLAGYGTIIFDEFHERSLPADLDLAFALDCRAHLRPDLKLLFMSATLPAEEVRGTLGDIPLIEVPGRTFPVEVLHRPPLPGEKPGDGAARLTIEADRIIGADGGGGDILVFLPGFREMHAARRAVGERSPNPRREIHLLHGKIPIEEQRRALNPPPGGAERIILATNVAETSLTIPGVRAVVDSGLARRVRYDPRTGMDHWDTAPISGAAAEQRKGRAGRFGPGVCLRWWSNSEPRPEFSPPEILESDMAPLLLETALWGAASPYELAWITPPPRAAVERAASLLRTLHLVDESGRITDPGRRAARMGVHPRLGRMLMAASERGWLATAAVTAAIIEEGDPVPGGDPDFRDRLEAWAAWAGGRRDGLPDGPARRISDEALRICRGAGSGLRAIAGADIDPDLAGKLLLLAYPDRAAQRTSGGDGGTLSRWILSTGRGARLEGPLSKEKFLVAADLDGGETDARIFLAAPVGEDDIAGGLAGDPVEEYHVDWDGWTPRSRSVTRVGSLVLKESGGGLPPAETIMERIRERIAKDGTEILPWSAVAKRLRARCRFVQRFGRQEGWPDFSPAALAGETEQWLLPFARCGGGPALTEEIVFSAIEHRLGRERRRLVEALAPDQIDLPSGTRKQVDYESGDIPIVAARLQEFFGCRETPRLCGEPVLLHLLSPAGRPVQITRDLGGFWERSYPEVKKELRGRYPKHPWPDDPLAAEPTARAKPRKR